MHYLLLLTIMLAAIGCTTIASNTPEVPNPKLSVSASSTTTTSSVKTNETGCNSTEDCSTRGKKDFKQYLSGLNEHGSVQRAFFVLIGVTGIIIVYFLVRAIRLRRRSTKVRKYGLLSNSDKYEMEPLDQDEDDEEDVTVYEMNGRKK